MGVWAMRSRLRYFVQPIYQPALTESESNQLQEQNISSREERAAAHKRQNCEKNYKSPSYW